MKICMLSTAHSPLDDRIYYKETVSLARKYGHIVLVAPGEKSDYRDDVPGIEYVPIKKSGTMLSRLLALPRAVITVLKIRPRVCHFHDFELIFALPFIRLFSRCKVIYDVHESYPEVALESKKIPQAIRPCFSKLISASERILSGLAHCIITPVDGISERFRKFHNNVSTIFNYPRRDIFVPDGDKLAELKKRYNGRIPIIYQGGISRERGLFQMIDAMKILKAGMPEIILLLVGPINDGLLEEAKSKIVENSLNDSIEIVGSVPHKEVVNYVSISKVGLVPLLPTRQYLKAIAIKQFEYMACGVPVLGAKMPLIESYIKASGCGRVYDSTSPEALASGVMEILSDESEWKRMSEAGREAVKNLWNWDEMEKRLFAVYEELLEK
jgi:glycosyltransferase involved in cell wall biosynthesis